MSKNTFSISLRLMLPALLLSVVTSSLVTPAFAKVHHADKTAVAITAGAQSNSSEQSAKRSTKKVRAAKDDALPNIPFVGESGMDTNAD